MKVHLTKAKGNFVPLGEDILVTNMYFGEERSSGGIILSNDDGKLRGIRARWCQVYKIGQRCKLKDQINEGDWILLEHGRWSRQFLIEDNDGVDWVLQKADIDAILLVSEEEPLEVTNWIKHVESKNEYVDNFRVDKKLKPLFA
jgi:co-chaperonin GroES (HSP10)